MLTNNPVRRIPEISFVRRPEDPTPAWTSVAAQPRIDWSSPLLAFTREELVNRLGINVEVVEAGQAAGSETMLYQAIDQAPGWQSDALFSLACGESIESVIEGLELNTPLPSPYSEVGAFDTPAAQSDFARITSDEDLANVLAGSFAEWRMFLHPDQRRYAYKDSYNGAFRLKGGAGTGKTVVALHRARHLAQRIRRRESSSRPIRRPSRTTSSALSRSWILRYGLLSSWVTRGADHGRRQTRCCRLQICRPRRRRDCGPHFAESAIEDLAITGCRRSHLLG